MRTTNEALIIEASSKEDLDKNNEQSRYEDKLQIKRNNRGYENTAEDFDNEFEIRFKTGPKGKSTVHLVAEVSPQLEKIWKRCILGYKRKHERLHSSSQMPEMLGPGTCQHYVRIHTGKSLPGSGSGGSNSVKVYNIPTDVDELEGLLKQVFSRRNEVLDLEELYRDFAITHGRIAFDHTKSWPLAITYKISVKIRIGQINCMRSAAVGHEIRKVAEEKKLDMICLQEPYTRNGKMNNMPITAQIQNMGQNPMAVTVLFNKNIDCSY
ncbi:hypothetical protein JTB14_016127 [Gonioctena quinquepunctata]|nr:hypothetical protein JTB14_016127 [Gonioctena quinquepunctata]